jgi:hypothetical protein
LVVVGGGGYIEANIREKKLLFLQYEQEIERLQKDVEHLKLKLEQAEKQHDRQQRGSGTDSPDIDSSEQDSTHDLRDPLSPGQGDTNMKNIIARSVFIRGINTILLPPLKHDL